LSFDIPGLSSSKPALSFDMPGLSVSKPALSVVFLVS
jgi:hypothetical protein